MRKKHSGGHGGAWKVAYADFVTAMMAFFLVLWILGLSPKVKSEIEEYFKTPVSSGLDLLYFNGFMAKQIPVPFKTSWPTVTGPSFEVRPKSRQNIKNIKALKDELRRIDGADANMLVTDDESEVRIELVDKQTSSLFNNTNYQFTEHLKRMLTATAEVVQKMPNRLALEGHTNSLPYVGPGGETNWELSTERANNARLILEKNGVSSQQIIEIKGCADHMLLKKDDPAALTNRRISIVIKRKLPFSSQLEESSDNSSGTFE